MSIFIRPTRQLSTPSRPLGAIPHPDGVFFRIWAPRATTVSLIIEGHAVQHKLERTDGDYFEAFIPDAKAGDQYHYTLNNERLLPDPGSRYQPFGVHGPSQVIDPYRYRWNDDQWQGIAQPDLVFYEVHVGAFTADGTFRSVEERLGYLKDLGVNAIELMPIAEFAGRWNWGYDPAAFFAPSHRYGTPDDLRRLIDAAHQIGIAVFLDVVYNHFGPDGSYAALFGHFFSAKHKSPWGQGINLDDVDNWGVRNFFIDNALHWLREYHMDGLRLDATHALQDDSPQHFLAELSAAVNLQEGRKRYLIAEDERNLSRVIRPREQGGFGMDGVWADDFHHQIRNITAGDTEAYFIDFAETKASDIAKSITSGWYYQGQRSLFSGALRGTDPQGTQLFQFVHCIQNHDQVGNRPVGDRLHHRIRLSTYRAASALLLFSPATPLLFMGQEWAASSPFQFFTDHKAELGRRITEGRRREFEGFAGYQGEVPDPQDPESFIRSKLNWSEITLAEHSGIHELYRDLLSLRRLLPHDASDFEVQCHGQFTLSLRRGRYSLLVSLADNQALELSDQWEALWHTEDSRYAVAGEPPQQKNNKVRFPRAAAMVCQLKSYASLT